MFELFNKEFKLDFLEKDVFTPHEKLNSILGKANGALEFLERYSGGSFNCGLYRVHKYQDIIKWNAILNRAFPNYAKYGVCFSYDWLGRHFALDFQRKQNGEPMILMLEPGTGEQLEIPATFDTFHEQILREQQAAALAVNFFSEWKSINHLNIKHSQCVGYKIPLFLGGGDTIENLELSDMEVYWEICAQALNQTRNMPKGTKIENFKISD